MGGTALSPEQRLTYLKIGAGACGALLFLNWFVITPAMSAWTAQSARIDALRQKLEKGQQLVQRETSIRGHWAQMQRESLPSEVSLAENQAFEGIGRWERDAGISFASLTPQWQDHDEGYRTLNCRATATGTQAAIGRFLYDMQTDNLPVNLEEFDIASRDERGAILTLTCTFSFLQLSGTSGGG